MSEVLFVTWDGGGNVPPAIEIARELQHRGHRVRFLGQAQQRELLEHGGFEFSAYTRPGSWTATGRRGAIKNAVGFLRLLTGRTLGRDLLAEVAHVTADIVIIDCLLFGALDVAARAGLRHAVLVHSLVEAIETKMSRGAPGAIARLRGLNPRKLWAGSGLVIAATLKDLDRVSGPGSPSNLHYTGPAIPAVTSLTRPHSAEPLILVSLSTTYLPKQTAVLQNILDALADLPVRVISTTGPSIDPGSIRPPANAEAHEYVPHAEIMADVSLVIGHGGHSTTMLALAHNVPLLILPMNMAFDQPIIGQAIQRSGAGLTIPARSPQHEIRAAVQRMLADDSFRHGAARLGAATRSANGTQAAADLLLAVIPQVPAIDTEHQK